MLEDLLLFFELLPGLRTSSSRRSLAEGSQQGVASVTSCCKDFMSFMTTCFSCQVCRVNSLPEGVASYRCLQKLVDFLLVVLKVQPRLLQAEGGRGHNELGARLKVSNVTDQIGNLLRLPLVLGRDRVRGVCQSHGPPSHESRCQGPGFRPALQKPPPLMLRASRWPLLKLCKGHRKLELSSKSGSQCANKSPRHQPAIPGFVSAQEHTRTNFLRSASLCLLFFGPKASSLPTRLCIHCRTGHVGDTTNLMWAQRICLGSRQCELRVEVREPGPH